MSIQPYQAPLENSQTRAPEREEELPPQLIAKAKAAAREFFEDRELKILTSQTTQDWVVEKIVPAMAHIEKANSQIAETDATLFLEHVSKQIAPMMNTLGNISFSRGYEMDNYIYPSVDEFNEISNWLDNLRDGYQSYKKIPNFPSRFCEIFIPFLDTLVTAVREEALLSRNLQLEKILLDPTHPEFDFRRTVTAAHIDALNTKPMQPLLELRDLLNLSRNSRINRIPTMKEQRGFQLLLEIFSLRERNRP